MDKIKNTGSQSQISLDWESYLQTGLDWFSG